MNDLIGPGDALGEDDQDLKPVLIKMTQESATNSRTLAALINNLGGKTEAG
jgi:hypothetical protein